MADFMECHTECALTNDCQVFSYEASKTCTLMKDTLSTMISEPGTNSGYIVLDPACFDFDTKAEGTVHATFNNVENALECQKLCDLDATCEKFNYLPNNDCQMTSGGTTGVSFEYSSAT